MRTAKGAVRDLPTHVLKDLTDFGIEAVPRPPEEIQGLVSTRTRDHTETGDGGGWRPIFELGCAVCLEGLSSSSDESKCTMGSDTSLLFEAEDTRVNVDTGRRT